MVKSVSFLVIVTSLIYLYGIKKGPLAAYKSFIFYWFQKGKTSPKVFLETFTICFQHLPYFRCLNGKNKGRFIARLHALQEQIQFISITQDNVVPTLIAAGAVQLTFRMDENTDLGVYTIYVDQNSSDSANGSLHFTSDEVLAGFADADDTINVVLFTWGKVLQEHLIADRSVPVELKQYLNTWMSLGHHERLRQLTSDTSFLRKAAAIEKSSFFGLCIEHFFESPESFRLHLPDLYNYLCVILGQNPAQYYLNYRLTEDWYIAVQRHKHLTRLPKSLKKQVFSYKWHWSFTLLFMGIVVCLPTYWNLSQDIGISAFDIFILLIVSAGLGYRLHYDDVVHTGWMNPRFYFAFIISGYANFMLLLVLAANYYLPSEHWVEEHFITGVSKGRKHDMILHFEDEVKLNYTNKNICPYKFMSKNPTKDKIRYDYYVGFLGYPVLKNVWYISAEKGENRIE